MLDGLEDTTFAGLIDELKEAAPKTRVVKRFVDNAKLLGTSDGLERVGYHSWIRSPVRLFSISDRSVDRPKPVTSNLILLFLVMAGAVLRLIQLLANRSLWIDEAALALNLLQRSFISLTGHLDYGQMAPIGFLWLEKGVMALFGSGETALRLFPFVCGLVSLVLFALICDAILPAFGAVASVALLAANHQLVYFSSEVKQYIVDVAVAATLLAVGLALVRGPFTPGRVAAGAIMGAVAGWMSHPACYLLAGIGAALAVTARVRRNRRALLASGALGVFWLITVVPSLVLARRNPSGGDLLVLPRYWATGFAPTGSFSDVVHWLPEAFGRQLLYLFEPGASGWRLGPLTVAVLIGALALASVSLARRRPDLFFLISGPIILALVGGAARLYPFTGRLSLGKLMVAVLIGALALGSVSLARRRPELFILVSGPIILALVGGAARLYPFRGRVMLFLIPLLLLLVGEGIGVLWQGAGRLGVVLAVAAGSLLLAETLATTLSRLPEAHEELRPVLEKMIQAALPGDSVYVHNGGVRAYQYYRTRLRFPQLDVTLGCCSTNQWPRYVEALQKLGGRPRVWLVLAHWDLDGLEPSFLLLAMDRFGRRLAEFRAKEAAAYLYELPPVEPEAVRAVLNVIPPDRNLSEADWLCSAGPLYVAECVGR